MKAMILAAGLGTRLRPLTETTPKPLLPVGGTPLIVWNLLLLRAGGIREVIINLHYLGSMIEAALGDGSRWDMQIAYSYEPELLGTGGGLKKAEEFFEGESFLVMNGDTLTNVDLPALQEFHRSQAGVATLVLRDDPHAEQWGAVESDAQDRILRINGRGPMVVGVIYLLSQRWRIRACLPEFIFFIHVCWTGHQPECPFRLLIPIRMHLLVVLGCWGLFMLVIGRMLGQWNAMHKRAPMWKQGCCLYLIDCWAATRHNE
jgi:CTP:phosphocholine cytidylyltransferase-like protein